MGFMVLCYIWVMQFFVRQPYEGFCLYWGSLPPTCSAGPGRARGARSHSRSPRSRLGVRDELGFRGFGGFGVLGFLGLGVEGFRV